MRNMIQRFMYGRYGSDQLNLFLMGMYAALFLLAVLSDFGLFSLVADLLLFFCLFRMLSRNIYKRRDENARFMKRTEPIQRWWRLQGTIRRDKEHRYFKCPNCSQYLRVPRGKGKITVTCRSCGASFQEKS